MSPKFRAALLAGAVSLAPVCAHAQTQVETANPTPPEDDDDVIVVQATRSGRRVQDEALRVEVVGRDEIEEKIMMTPGNVGVLVSESPGVRVQTTSPALGAANVRIQGLKGRYTQLLADGLPLYGGQTPSIGLLQIPPTDLGQVEIIKGAASALYGPSALGGVINLVSRRPKAEPQFEALVNLTSRNGQDVTVYGATPLSPDVGLSLTGGYDRQARQDLDRDGWADMPFYRRWTMRTRLFWESGGAKAMLTAGAMDERRTGGTLPGRTVPDGQPFVQAQASRRIDAGFTAEAPIDGIGTFHLRAAAVGQRHRHVFGPSIEPDRHRTLFAETSLAGKAGETNWLLGAAVQADRFRSRPFPMIDYSYTVPGLFAQAERELVDRLTLETSLRFDAHSDYGSHLSPRLSALYRPGPWRVRGSIGRGFYAPTPFVEEIEDAGLSRLEPLAGLRAETADTASIDIGYARGRIEGSVTLFGSNIAHAIQLRPVDADSVRLVNAAGPTRTRGTELMLRYRLRPFTITGSYVYLDAHEPDPAGVGRRAVPLTPKHRAGLVGMWEQAGRGRIGVEAYYTGRQTLDDNPYRTRSRPYVELGLLGEIVLGRVRLFLNAENLLDVRQSRYDSLLRPGRGVDGRWTVDAWAPTDGRVVNGGVRIALGGAIGRDPAEVVLRRRPERWRRRDALLLQRSGLRRSTGPHRSRRLIRIMRAFAIRAPCRG